MSDLHARSLAQRKLPVENRLGSGDFDPTSNKIKVMTMKVNKGLEFPVVALPGVGHMPAAWEDEKKAVRVFYVAATRATQRLVMGWGKMVVFAPDCDTRLDVKYPTCY
jgi:superfamily I DNA/RNA helicase